MKRPNLEGVLSQFFLQIFIAALEAVLLKHDLVISDNVKENEDEFLDAKKSAEFIGESLSSFYRRTSNREIPFYKRGKKIFCKKSELKLWLEEGKKKTRAEIRREVA